MNKINSVQSFVRTVAFLVVLGVLFLVEIPLFSLARGDAMPVLITVFLIVNSMVASIMSKMFFILPEWERVVLLRLGKFAGVRGPGYFVIPPFVYSVADILDTRIMTKQVEATDTLTKDNVPIKVTAALEFNVENPEKAIIRVQNYLSSVIWLSTEALKNTIGSLDLKELLSNREEIAASLKEQIDAEAENYGINVRAVRITDITTPEKLIEELAVIARANRASKAKQIQADTEVAVAHKLREASDILEKSKGGFKLRELQILSEMSKEESSMIIIYPQGDSRGKGIANAAVSLKKRA
jgi:regulator of protease activity HflC (stomatin/prohibitin superfamily)